MKGNNNRPINHRPVLTQAGHFMSKKDTRMAKLAKGTWLLILAITQSAIEAVKAALVAKGRRRG